MNKFLTIGELRLEKQKLYLKKEFLEEEIEQDFVEFRESLNPFNIIKSIFHSEEKSNENSNSISPIAITAGSTLLELIVSKLFFKKSSFLKSIVSSSLIRAVGPTILSKAVPAISSLIQDFFEKRSKKNKSYNLQEQSTASDAYW